VPVRHHSPQVSTTGSWIWAIKLVVYSRQLPASPLYQPTYWLRGAPPPAPAQTAPLPLSPCTAAPPAPPLIALPCVHCMIRKQILGTYLTRPVPAVYLQHPPGAAHLVRISTRYSGNAYADPYYSAPEPSAAHSGLIAMGIPVEYAAGGSGRARQQGTAVGRGTVGAASSSGGGTSAGRGTTSSSSGASATEASGSFSLPPPYSAPTQQAMMILHSSRRIKGGSLVQAALPSSHQPDPHHQGEDPCCACALLAATCGAVIGALCLVTTCWDALCGTEA